MALHGFAWLCMALLGFYNKQSTIGNACWFSKMTVCAEKPHNTNIILMQPSVAQCVPVWPSVAQCGSVWPSATERSLT